jgi:hypothetical protein
MANHELPPDDINRKADDLLDSLEETRAAQQEEEMRFLAKLNRGLIEPAKAKENLSLYAQMLASAFPVALEDYGINSVTRISINHGNTRVVVASQESGEVILYVEVRLHDFMGREGTEQIVVLPFRTNGKNHHSVFFSQEHPLIEMAHMCVEQSRLQLEIGKDRENEQKVEALAKRASYALEMAELSDAPRENLEVYFQRLMDAFPEAVLRVAKEFKPEVEELLGEGVIAVDDGDHIMLIRSKKTGRLLFSLEVKPHSGYSSSEWLVVHTTDKNNKASGFVIDIRDKTMDELVREAIKEGMHTNPPTIFFETSSRD